MFSGYWMVNGTKLKECRVEMYQWDAVAQNFGYAKKLSKEMGKEYCQAVMAKLRK